MSEERINWTQEQLDSRLVIGSIGGKAFALEDQARAFKVWAGELFANGKDAEAVFLRDTVVPKLEKEAQRLRDQQELYRKGHDERYGAE